jgi:hypothetical protein
VQKTDEELDGVKNLGSKSIEEIKVALAGLGLSLGMRIDPNLLGALGRGGPRNEARPGRIQAGRVTATAGRCSATSSWRCSGTSAS